jgi:hypothetical protein
MSMSVLTLPSPGWYPDPTGAATYRWWDGSAWTEGTHAGDGTSGVVPGQLFADPEPEPVVQAAPEAPVLSPDPPHASAMPVAPAAIRRNVQATKTRWASLLAAFPVVYPLVVGMSAGIAYAGGAASSMVTVIGIAAVVAVLALIPAWVFAANDRRELEERGYAPAPALTWMLLLPPFAYLIARRRVVGP